MVSDYNADFIEWAGGPLGDHDVREFSVGVWGHHDYGLVEQMFEEFTLKLDEVTGGTATLMATITRDVGQEATDAPTS